MYALKRTVEPGALAVSLATVKTYLRLTTTDNDTDLTDLFIPAAIDLIEQKTHRQLITATYTLKRSYWPRGCRLYLPKGQLQSVSSITYVDADGVTQTWDSSKYEVETDPEPGYINLVAGETWPTSLSPQGDHAITITFVCGYGGSATSIPARVKAAVLFQVAHLFDMRSAVVTGTIATQIPETLNALIDLIRLQDQFFDYGWYSGGANADGGGVGSYGESYSGAYD